MPRFKFPAFKFPPHTLTLMRSSRNYIHNYNPFKPYTKNMPQKEFTVNPFHNYNPLTLMSRLRLSWGSESLLVSWLHWGQVAAIASDQPILPNMWSSNYLSSPCTWICDSKPCTKTGSQPVVKLCRLSKSVFSLRHETHCIATMTSREEYNIVSRLSNEHDISLQPIYQTVDATGSDFSSSKDHPRFKWLGTYRQDDRSQEAFVPPPQTRRCSKRASCWRRRASNCDRFAGSASCRISILTSK